MMCEFHFGESFLCGILERRSSHSSITLYYYFIIVAQMLVLEKTFSDRQEISRLAGMTRSCVGWVQEAKHLMWVLVMFFGTPASEK